MKFYIYHLILIVTFTSFNSNANDDVFIRAIEEGKGIKEIYELLGDQKQKIGIYGFEFDFEIPVIFRTNITDIGVSFTRIPSPNAIKRGVNMLPFISEIAVSENVRKGLETTLLSKTQIVCKKFNYAVETYETKSAPFKTIKLQSSVNRYLYLINFSNEEFELIIGEHPCAVKILATI